MRKFLIDFIINAGLFVTNIDVNAIAKIAVTLLATCDKNMLNCLKFITRYSLFKIFYHTGFFYLLDFNGRLYFNARQLQTDSVL
jgi:hypothetical protein